jgi:hypothetical protein
VIDVDNLYVAVDEVIDILRTLHIFFEFFVGERDFGIRQWEIGIAVIARIGIE